MDRFLLNFTLALDGVMQNRLRAFLTALGILFGVAAVIAMLAIGTGAERVILDQMKLIGSNNIVIRPLSASDDIAGSEGEDPQEKRPFSPGLTLDDMQAIQTALNTVENVSPEIEFAVSLIRADNQIGARCIGVSNHFFELQNLEVAKGHFFSPVDFERKQPVCIIGSNVEKKLFGGENPVGQHLKCKGVWLRVVGVLKDPVSSTSSVQELGLRSFRDQIYIPYSTALRRFRNRAFIDKSDLGRRYDEDKPENKNYHQLDKLIVRVSDSKYLTASAEVIGRMLKRRHNDVLDYEIQIPEVILKQKQETQKTFNLVLAVIAGISLLVGGIGIMNIMLASVLERVKEIGVRRSFGATREDIIWQFLNESVLISLFGGILGVALGFGAARLITFYSEIPTIISGWSIAISFGIAFLIGLVFGILPAQRAAELDPIKALRSD